MMFSSGKGIGSLIALSIAQLSAMIFLRRFVLTILSTLLYSGAFVKLKHRYQHWSRSLIDLDSIRLSRASRAQREFLELLPRLD
ncbi:hypothetical protein LENED_003625 [Lentinula edodes]|uniref:Uncharacterized protein n=1 Tax=Lentinula edodes TaxID=5353 RepID=A0A1Q3E4P1_LENED|nr:hypothetical protein LENED_003625 [Lentinula edodes]